MDRIDLVGSINTDKLKNRLNESLPLSHHGYTNHVNRLDESFDGHQSPALSSSRAQNGVVHAQQRPSDQVIEVQIVPQDSWTDAGAGGGTAGAGNMSDVSASFVDDLTAVTGSIGRRSSRRQRSFAEWQSGAGLYRDSQDECVDDGGTGWWQQRRSQLGVVITWLVAVCAVLSPVIMLLAPRTKLLAPLLPASLMLDHHDDWSSLGCSDLECDGQLAALAFKLLVLVVGCWAVLGELAAPPTRSVSLPRVDTQRVLLTSLVLIVTLAYWLFLCVRVAEAPPVVTDTVAASAVASSQPGPLVYVELVRFAGSLTDTLLWLHYLALLVLLLRPRRRVFVIDVLRSPDGVTRHFTVGRVSVQSAAAFIVRRYYADFPVYNPYSEGATGVAGRKLARQASSVSSYKYYDIDSNGADPTGSKCITQKMSGGGVSSRRHDSTVWRHHDLHEHERRVSKRRARLVAAAEDAFTHIRRLRDNQHDGEGVNSVMSPQEAAQAIFPSMARPLQKYLRVTRQQPLHTASSIVEHLALCLTHDMSPRAFLQRYLEPASTLHASGSESRRLNDACVRWSLVCCDRAVSASLTPRCVFQLRHCHVQLLCRVAPLPQPRLLEQLVDPLSNRFQLRLNSETSV